MFGRTAHEALQVALGIGVAQPVMCALMGKQKNTRSRPIGHGSGVNMYEFLPELIGSSTCTLRVVRNDNRKATEIVEAYKQALGFSGVGKKAQRDAKDESENFHGSPRFL